MADIKLEHISKTYDDTAVLTDLSLTIREGEFLTLLGASGCGKSTLLRLLAGLELPDTGTLRKGDVDMLSLSPGERDCAMVFQSYALYPHMTVGDNICTPLYMRMLRCWQRLPGMRWLSPHARRQIKLAHRQGHRVAQTLGIDTLWSRKPAQLSGGQRQRVALARAMVRRPTVFLFDEPLSNLDAGLRQSLRGEIRQLHDALNVTFVYVTHDQHEAMSMSDRIAVMKGGCILQLGTPAEIYDCPQHKDVAALVGTPRINFITLTRDADGRANYQGHTIDSLVPANTAVLAFRPHTARRQNGPNSLGITGQITLVEFTGTEQLVTLKTLTETSLTAIVDKQQRCVVGDVMTIYVACEDLHGFDAQGGRVELIYAARQDPVVPTPVFSL
ncbi:ABC transporter ATP-binding protein [Acerihabitans sp. TG2]|uniref:ABC transporter ATP-binding protein n=1 Tax=Acerihabitans sp. TG2 TaxID=3096008 RepID=UPI002B22D5F5|nr:ABC transporter ATP-binding protein [Acerihabitans sp. TG2]MEA9390382.1 ABC transporter ATP-binding protein [Acerihabitans sp. TG2]